MAYSPAHDRVSQRTAWFLIGIGLLLFLLHFVKRPEYEVLKELPEEHWINLLLAFGACFTGLGIYFLVQHYREKRLEAPIPADWQRSRVTQFRWIESFPSIGPHFLPLNLEATAEVAGQSRTLRTPDLYFDARPWIGPSTALYIAWLAERPAQAKIDLSMLPKIVFVPWQVIFYGKKEWLERLKNEGQSIDTRFSGWKNHGSSEDLDYENALAIFQYLDPVSRQLYVFEGFVLDNRNAPFPSWTPGTRFRGWMRVEKSTDFYIERMPE